MPRLFRNLFLPVLLLLLTACAVPAQAPPADDPTLLNVEGRIAYQVIEGGFWGLVGDDGQNYLPDRLPAQFQVDGLTVRAVLRPLPPGVSTRMWGKRVELVRIEQR